MIQSTTGKSAEPLQNSSKDSDFSLLLKPPGKGSCKASSGSKVCAHLGGGASLHRHVVTDLQAVIMMSEKSGFAA